VGCAPAEVQVVFTNGSCNGHRRVCSVGHSAANEDSAVGIRQATLAVEGAGMRFRTFVTALLVTLIGVGLGAVLALENPIV
jgi:hypothetical protein